MRVAGIIVEFNPFHNGHSAHIRQTKEITGCQYVVAAMSGNFVQRGEPAICDKWQRTKMALHNGVDVVVEIPLPYVIAGADYFARGSVGVMAATGVVDTLCFGSESGDLAAIQKAGEILANEPEVYKTVLRHGLDQGLSFAAAKGKALAACMPHAQEGLFAQANNGLAIEYCKALALLGSKMGVATTHRTEGGPSATKIRKVATGDGRIFDVPDNVGQMLAGIDKFATIDDFSDVFRYLIYSGGGAVGQMGEGLIHRFRRLCGDHTSISSLLEAVKTKRYTYTRLQRGVMCTILGVGADTMAMYDSHGGAQYVRVLGFRKDAAHLVGDITRKATLPVITNGKMMDEILQGEGSGSMMLQQEFMAGDIYRLAIGAPGGYRGERGEGVVVV